MTIRFWREPELQDGWINWTGGALRSTRRGRAWLFWHAATFYLPWHSNRWLRILMEEFTGEVLAWRDFASPEFGAKWLNEHVAARRHTAPVPGTLMHVRQEKGVLPGPTETLESKLGRAEGLIPPDIRSLPDGIGPSAEVIERAVSRGVPRAFARLVLFPIPSSAYPPVH